MVIFRRRSSEWTPDLSFEQNDDGIWFEKKNRDRDKRETLILFVFKVLKREKSLKEKVKSNTKE